MSDDVLVVVRTFFDRVEAELAQGALQAAGIESMVRSDDAGRMKPALAFTNGAALLVRAEDAREAEDVLSLMPSDGETE
ncbi:MAG: hypothetical protein A3F69_04820 [Acidobacteria bacterium RIFCSPLOWO2_12_FULL_66_10]|nr:MAG: hypothetical protein A3F69_04820 [Acidobacteria bacterium RIFCSPLOWO2_12_FULL_66_10]